MKKAKSLIPVPKVLVPAVAGLFYIAARWVSTGHLDREELGLALLAGGYAAIGWTTPEGPPPPTS